MAEPTQEEFDAAAEKQYPWIEWRKPIPISIVHGRTGLGCRLCIARNGFRATDGRLFDTQKEFDTHMRVIHGQQHGH